MPNKSGLTFIKYNYPNINRLNALYCIRVNCDGSVACQLFLGLHERGRRSKCEFIAHYYIRRIIIYPSNVIFDLNKFSIDR